MDDVFAIRRSYGYALYGTSVVFVGFFFWLAFQGFVQQQAPWWQWALLLGLFTALGSLLFAISLKQMQTTFNENGVQRRGFHTTQIIAWNEVQELSDETFTAVVLKTAHQQLKIDLNFYRTPYRALAAIRERVPPAALRTKWQQIVEQGRAERRKRVISFWTSLVFAVVLLLLFVPLTNMVGQPALATVLLWMLLIALSVTPLFDLYAWYQRREIATGSNM